MQELSKKYLTRRQAVVHIREKYGVPVSKSTIDKRPPKPDAYYGNRELFTEPTLKKYAGALISDKPNRLLDDTAA
jgi:hypothetical protein